MNALRTRPLLCPQLVGREREPALLGQLLDAARAGGGGHASDRRRGGIGHVTTGRAALAETSAIMQIADGQVATLWAEFDQLGLMKQLTGEVRVAEAAERGI